MTPFKQFAGKHLALAAILLLGALLRCIGITWGIPTARVPHLLSHFDEDTVMSTLAQVDLAQGDWNPDWAHNEGPLNYFFWVGSTAAMQAIGIIDRMPNEITDLGDPDYFRIVVAGRIMTVLFDLCSILLVYLIVMKMGGSKRSALLGALLFALFPFEIMHSHYMRPHILGNTFVCLVIYASLFIYDNRRGVWPFVSIGLLLGLAAVTRYNLLPVAIVPYAVFLYKRFLLDRVGGSWKAVAGTLFNYRMVIVGMAFIAGVLLGDPPLLFDFASVREPFRYQLGTSAFGALTFSNILDLTTPLKYVVSVVPAGAFTLWLVFYAAAVYACFMRGAYRFVLPLYLFMLPYFYYVTKAYGLIAVRPVMPVFPVLVIVSALAVNDVWRRCAAKRIVRYALSGMLGLVCTSTLFFDLACVTSMARRTEDPFVQVYDYFAAAAIPHPLKVGFIGKYWERYQTRNFAHILNAVPGQQATVSGPGTDFTQDRQDFILLFEFDDTMTADTKNRLAELTASNDYALERVFRKRLAFLGVEFGYDAKPTDFRYAFPVIYLLKATH